MKLFIVLALCLSAVAAEELHDRGVDFHTLHYNQHHQTVEEAKKNIGYVYDGQHADFEAVGDYSSLARGGMGTVGLSSSGLAASAAGGNAEYSSSATSNFGASHSANFASSSSYGNNADYASYAGGSYGASGSHGGGSVVIPVAAGTGSSSYLESSAAENVLTKDYPIQLTKDYPLHLTKEGPVVTPLVYNSPSAGSDKYYHHEEHRVSNAASPVVYTAPSTSGAENWIAQERHGKSQTSVPVIQFAPSSGGSENYVRHEERRVQNSAVPAIQYRVPSESSEKYLHIQSEHVQQKPVQLIVSSPGGSQESFMKYRQVTATATQPQVFVHTVPSASSSYIHHSSSGSTSGSQLGHLVTGGLTAASTSHSSGHYGNAAFVKPSTSFGFDSVNSIHNSGFGSSHHAASTLGASSALTASQLNKLPSSSFGSEFGSQSQFGSQFGAESSFNSGSSFGASSSSSGLHNYMQEARRLAELQARGMSVGGTRTSGSQFNANAESSRLALSSNMESANTAGFGGFGSLAASGAANSGYKTKSWEKASKWSSQSEFGPDGQVNNYKELSTGESENFDINGRRAGYSAATSTLDDNGKLSSYSVHS